MPELTIRRAAPADAERIAPLFEAYLRFYKRPPAPGAALAYLAARLEADEAVIFMAESGRETVGFTQLYPTWGSLALQRVWVLHDLFVVTHARRQGVASRLLARAVAFARETGAAHLTLETAVDNRAAQTLYETLGWERETAFYQYTFDLDDG